VEQGASVEAGTVPSWPPRQGGPGRRVRAVAFHGGVAEFVDQVVNTRTGEIFEVVATSSEAWWLNRDGSEGQMTLRRLDDGTTFVVHLRQP
jgi:hypothetical protein